MVSKGLGLWWVQGKTLAFLLLLSACQPAINPDKPPVLIAESFAALPGWQEDHIAEAIPALLRSCDRPPAGWDDLCRAARQLGSGDDAARLFVEKYFQPYEVLAQGTGTALFTGYYEPEVAGSRRASAGYATPIHSRPADLHVPYLTRAQIEDGGLRRKRLELAWLADPADAFFLQIQGSGRIRLPDGGVMRVGYAGQNGRAYVPIGRLLVDRGEMTLAEASMQSIRAWLAAHPDQAAGLMRQNPSYVFFREFFDVASELGPVGALGVPLTPGRSLAVDRRFMALGAPVFIDTTDPVDGRPLRRLMLAQDTGGAIRGALRGDVFFGWGPRAEQLAGLMKQPGRMWLLQPRGIAVSATGVPEVFTLGSSEAFSSPK